MYLQYGWLYIVKKIGPYFANHITACYVKKNVITNDNISIILLN